jgi:hypothetical protein
LSTFEDSLPPEHSSQRGLGWCPGALCIEAHESKIVEEEMYSWWAYLFERWIGIFCRGRDGGVEVGALGVDSLILIPLVDFPLVFIAFFGGVGRAVTFCLPAWAFKVLALALTEGPLIDSSPRGWAKTRMAGIEISPSKLGSGEMKLSNACIQTEEVQDYKKARHVVLTRAPYWVSLQPDMVGTHLLISQPAGGVLKHFFQELHQML